MKWFAVLLLVSVGSTGGYAASKQYDTGTIMNVEQKVHTRVLYYQVNTPITKDDPYYEISVQVKDTIYIGEYNPRHSADTLPEEWNVPRAEVRVRVEKRSIYLIRPTGTEVQVMIEKRVPAPAPPAKTTTDPAPSRK
jgi:hypothetical protein